MKSGQQSPIKTFVFDLKSEHFKTVTSFTTHFY